MVGICQIVGSLLLVLGIKCCSSRMATKGIDRKKRKPFLTVPSYYCKFI